MASRTGALPPPSVRAVLITAAGWAGLAACLTLVYLGMRSVMDVGGACADGGPYVSAQSCPDGATAGLLLGIFGGFGFGFLASAGGIAVGGIWAATPILAWSALFGSLGWNFIDYGIVSAPGGEIEWGWAICGVMFWAMAAFPLLGLVPLIRGGSLVGAARSPGGSPGGEVVRLGGPGQPPRPPGPRAVTAMTFRRSADVVRRRPAPEQAALAGIAADFGAVISTTMAETPLDPLGRRDQDPLGGDDSVGRGTMATVGGGESTAEQAGARGSAIDPPVPGDGSTSDAGPRPLGGEMQGGQPARPEPAFTEGTQALLDRLERLADMRDRGLLGADEYETAKNAIMAELEGRA